MTNLKVKPKKSSIFKTTKKGNYYYRYRLHNQQKCVSLGTKRYSEALKKVKKELLPLIDTPVQSVVTAHVLHVRGWKGNHVRLPVSKI